MEMCVSRVHPLASRAISTGGSTSRFKLLAPRTESLCMCLDPLRSRLWIARDNARGRTLEAGLKRNTAVLATEQGTKSVFEAEHVIGEADHTIETLSRTIGDSAVSANQILASANQQATAMRQIRDAMHHIDLGTKQTLAAMRQSEQSARDLNSLGGQLSNLIQQNDDQNGDEDGRS